MTQASRHFVMLLAAGVSSCAFAQESAPLTRIDAVTYQRVVEENLDLRKEQARIETEASALRRKNANLLLDIQDLERKRDQLTALVAQLKTPDELAFQMARLNAEKVVLIREIERLRESLAVSASPVTNMLPAVAAPASNSDLFRKLEQENADLRQEMAKARAMGMNEAVAKEIAQKGEITLKSEAARRDSQYRSATEELEALRRHEAALKKALEAQAKKAFDADAALKKTRESLAFKEDEAAAAREKAHDAEGALRKLQAKAASSERSVIQKAESAAQVPALLAAGQKSLVAGKFKEAEKIYLEAFKREPANAVISYNLGVIYGDYLKDYPSAIKYYRNYLALVPKAADANLVRAWLIDLTAKSKW